MKRAWLTFRIELALFLIAVNGDRMKHLKARERRLYALIKDLIAERWRISQ